MSGWRERPATGRADLATRERYERRFRHHVLSLSNPRGRIVRLPCTFCAFPAAEAHHLRYEPDWVFIVVWACLSCHRRMEYGSLKILQKHICDYSSLVRNICLPGARREALDARTADVSFDFGCNANTESE